MHTFAVVAAKLTVRTLAIAAILTLAVAVHASDGADAHLDLSTKSEFTSMGQISAVDVTYAGSVAVGTKDGNVDVWLSSNPSTPTIANLASPVTAIAFSPDGADIAVGTADGHVAVLLARDLSRVDHFAGYGSGKPVVIDFSSAGTTIAVGYDNGTVKLWGLGQSEPFRTFDHHKKRILSVSFKYQDDDTLFVISQDKSMSAWHPSTGAQVSDFNLVTDNEKKLHGLAFKTAAVASESKRIAVWGYGFGYRGGLRDGTFAGDSSDWNWIKLLDSEGVQTDPIQDQQLSQKSNSKPLLALSDDGLLLAATGQSSSQNNEVDLYDVSHRTLIGAVQLPSAVECLSVRYGRSGYRVVAAAGQQVEIYPIVFDTDSIPSDTCVVYDVVGGDPDLARAVSATLRDSVMQSHKFVLINQKAMIELLSDINKRDILGLKRDDIYAKPPDWKYFIDASLNKTGDDQYDIGIQLTDKNGGTVKAAKTAVACAKEDVIAEARKLCDQMMRGQR